MRHQRARPRDDAGHFNPRTPCGVRPSCSACISLTGSFQSTHPLRGATHSSSAALTQMRISIHAPLAGCDAALATGPSIPTHFNPRTPCGVRPIRFVFADMYGMISIHAPLAGCDVPPRQGAAHRAHFNPRTPCGVRPTRSATSLFVSPFQSTHPLRGATRRKNILLSPLTISIHAPLAGCDRNIDGIPAWTKLFQSTHPLRGATYGIRIFIDIYAISIHAPLAGCDQLMRQTKRTAQDFNPRTPCGVRRKNNMTDRKIIVISIHAPLAGCDKHPRGKSYHP